MTAQTESMSTIQFDSGTQVPAANMCVELEMHAKNPTFFASSSWLDLAETFARLEENCYKGELQKTQDEAYIAWYKKMLAKFDTAAETADEEHKKIALEAGSYLRTVLNRAISFVEFIQLLSHKKSQVRNLISEIDEGPTNEAVRHLQYGIWWRGLSHAARVMGFSGIVAGVPGAAISFWEPYVTLIEDGFNVAIAPSLLTAASSIVFTAVLSIFTGMWMYRSGRLARAARKDAYQHERSKLMNDYECGFKEGCDEVDNALFRLTGLAPAGYSTFASRWPTVARRLAAEIDSCYFEKDDHKKP